MNSIIHHNWMGKTVNLCLNYSRIRLVMDMHTILYSALYVCCGSSVECLRTSKWAKSS